ncbi:MAG: TetR family transcriptional regulator [Actinobacteria bacterium]|nr:TetR family transcriptional regulator [Actinomycetota bacterium]
MAKSGPRAGTARHGKSADVRAALVDAAIDALREVGFAGASAREIAGRAGCSQALVFYHFGSVNELLLAALDEVSARRMAAYRNLLSEATSVTALAGSARSILTADLDAGYVRVLVEMITAAHAVPGLGEQVAARLRPWRELTEQAVRRALGRSAAARLLPPAEAAHALVAGFLGLELLASLDGDRTAVLAVLDKAGSLARLLDMLTGLRLPGGGKEHR